jgi:hypothetical protein
MLKKYLKIYLFTFEVLKIRFFYELKLKIEQKVTLLYSWKFGNINLGKYFL